MNKSIIIYGPAGCGKTHHGKALAKRFGLDKVVEHDEQRGPIEPRGVLYLTNQKPPNQSTMVMAFSDAMSVAGIKENSPIKQPSISIWSWAHARAAQLGYELRLNLGGGHNPSAALVPKETNQSKAAHGTLVFPTSQDAVNYLREKTP